MLKESFSNNSETFLYSKSAWEQDAGFRFNLDEFNQAFYESVPVLKYLQWSIRHIDRGSSETVLPLNNASTNQYITHQAALILLAADYTGGIALASLLQMTNIIGFHSMNTDFGAYLWGAKANIKWFYPSTDDLVCKAEIPVNQWERITKRFFSGKKVIETITIKMYNADKLVAESDFTYWTQDSYSLRANAFDNKRVHVLYDHKFKTSAKLIAGLRALEQFKNKDEKLYDDPLAVSVAGNHGITLAKRFCEYMPQLQNMVAARTKHLDNLLSSLDGDSPLQIINIGAGFDTRPWRLKLNNARFFELDLPLMLKVRGELLPAAESDHVITRIPIDLRVHRIDEVLFEHPNFNDKLPVIVIWEGGSMYFNEKDTQDIFSSIRKLLTHPESRVWFDYVSLQVVNNSTGISEVEAFVRGMRRMGEPFINGYSEIDKMLAQWGMKSVDLVHATDLLHCEDPIYSHYKFCLARG